jgi:hypothetical protein
MADKVTKKGYREFTATKTDGSKVKLSVRLPNQKELKTADLYGAVDFNKSLEAGLPPRAKMVRVLRKAGLWGEEDEKRLAELQKAYVECQVALRKDKFETPEAKAEVEKRLEEVADGLQEINAETNAMLSCTADARSDEAKKNFLIACVVEQVEGPEAGKRLYSGVDAFESEEDDLLDQRLRYEYHCCIQDVPSDWAEADAKAEAEKLAKAKEAEEAAKQAEEPAAPPVASAHEAAQEAVTAQVTLAGVSEPVAAVVG